MAPDHPTNDNFAGCSVSASHSRQRSVLPLDVANLQEDSVAKRRSSETGASRTSGERGGFFVRTYVRSPRSLTAVPSFFCAWLREVAVQLFDHGISIGIQPSLTFVLRKLDHRFVKFLPQLYGARGNLVNRFTQLGLRDKKAARLAFVSLLTFVVFDAGSLNEAA